jgi:hypothetical protein
MKNSTVVRAKVHDLAFDLISVLYSEWRAALHRRDAMRAGKMISGCIAAAIGISLAINVILSAPGHEDRYAGHYAVNGLHIAVPDNFRGIPVEQLIALP